MANTTRIQTSQAAIKEKLTALYEEIFNHDGYGHLQVEVKILRRGQKEVILRCGKEYRFVVDYPEKPEQADKVTSLVPQTAGGNRA